MKEMSAKWASSQQALDSKSYGDYMIDNPYKSDSTFTQDVIGNVKQETLSVVAFGTALFPGGNLLSLGLSSADSGSKFAQGDYFGFAASGIGATATAADFALSRPGGVSAIRGAVSFGSKGTWAV
jgi:hypothetical protein